MLQLILRWPFMGLQWDAAAGSQWEKLSWIGGIGDNVYGYWKNTSWMMGEFV